MSKFQLLLVAGTHGNELNAPWLFDEWEKDPDLINTYDINSTAIIGNPSALKVNKRYIDRDLNRSFTSHLLNSEIVEDIEVKLAKNLIRLYGIDGINPCQIAIDLHSTTAAMGSSLVIYGNRSSDFALAALIQSRLGLPIYLHEDDLNQKGFLVESWPCGLVVEIGPVPQSIIDGNIVEKNRIILEVIFEELSKVKKRLATYPQKLIIYRHIKSVDYPRHGDGSISSYINPEIISLNWKRLQSNMALFKSADGIQSQFEAIKDAYPVFINEAAYAEKKIALSFTKKEILNFQNRWSNDLSKLINRIPI